MAQYGGKFLVRGGTVSALEAGCQPSLVIIEFPSAERARAWHDSPEYRPLKELRQRTADTRHSLHEGT